ncbi:MAG: amidase [Proteobacteria bacterium]|nr:amidase [Pseudomonadota bacterium]
MQDSSRNILDLTNFAAAFRRRAITAESATATCLERIAAHDPWLKAFVHIARDGALAAARAVDALLAAGTDLGPLMGVPIAIKDLFTVAGMPIACGSRVDVRDLIMPEGPFVNALRRAGCVILGKTRTTEFAFGSFNLTHPTPLNPWDLKTPRMPGGSSSGSAVAIAGGLCPIAVGSDTGGSVRLPAAMCGVVGYKSTVGLWPLDGVFPLAPFLDSIGLFTNSAAEMALAFGALQGTPPPAPCGLRGLRLGRPRQHFFDRLDAEVAESFDAAMAMLSRIGVEIVPVDAPEAGEIDALWPHYSPVELLATLGRERVLANREMFDPVSWGRFSTVLDNKADAHIAARRRHFALNRMIGARMADCDAWVTPTAPSLPIAVETCPDVATASAWNGQSSRNTRPGNLFNQCGISLPIQPPDAKLSVGLQLSAGPNEDAKLLSIAQAVEAAIGRRSLAALGRLP